MHEKRFLGVALAALIVIGLLLTGGSAIHRAGWSQGYLISRLEARGQDGPVPQVPYAQGYRARPLATLGGVGMFLGIGFLVLLLGMAARLFHFWAWKTADGPKASHWARHWRWPHGAMPRGPVPPWCRGGEKPPEGPAEKPRPESESGPTRQES